VDTALVVDHDDLVVFASFFDLEGIVNLTRLQFFNGLLVITNAVAVFHHRALVTADAVVFVVLKQSDGEKVGALEDGGHCVSCVDVYSIARSGAVNHA